MSVIIRVDSLRLDDADDAGAVVGQVVLSITDDAVDADARVLGAGSTQRAMAVVLPRPAWTALLAELLRDESLPGTLDAKVPIAKAK